MFPLLQSSSARKKSVPAEDPLITKHKRQWQSVLSFLQQSLPSSMANINDPVLLTDLRKVCKIRNVPEFYTLYLLYFSSSATPQQQSQILTRQAEKTMAKTSHYFLIQAKIAERQHTLQYIKGLLNVISALDRMNEAKPTVDILIDKLIKEILDDCSTLQQVKRIEEQKYYELGRALCKNRQESLDLIHLIDNWRTELRLYANTEERGKLKIVFPLNNQYNALVSLKLDTGFLSSSVLGKAVNFIAKGDPLYLQVFNQKETSRVQQIILECLRPMIPSEVQTRSMMRLKEEWEGWEFSAPVNFRSRRASVQSMKSVSKIPNNISVVQQRDTPKKKKSKSPQKSISQSPKSQRSSSSRNIGVAKAGVQIRNANNMIEIVYRASPRKKSASTRMLQTMGSSRKSMEVTRSPSAKLERKTPSKKEKDQESVVTVKKPKEMDLSLSRTVGSAAGLRRSPSIQLAEAADKKLEEERRKQEKMKINYQKKIEKFDEEIRRIKEEKMRLEAEKKEVQKIKDQELKSRLEEIKALKKQLDGKSKTQSVADPTHLQKRHSTSVYAKDTNNSDSIAKVYSTKKIAKSKFQEQGEGSDKLQKMIEGERKKQWKQYQELIKKLGKYDDELRRVKEERDAQRAKLKEIEKLKEQRIREKEKELEIYRKNEKQAAVSPKPAKKAQFKKNNELVNMTMDESISNFYNKQAVEEIYRRSKGKTAGKPSLTKIEINLNITQNSFQRPSSTKSIRSVKSVYSNKSAKKVPKIAAPSVATVSAVHENQSSKQEKSQSKNQQQPKPKRPATPKQKPVPPVKKVEDTEAIKQKKAELEAELKRKVMEVQMEKAAIKKQWQEERKTLLKEHEKEIEMEKNKYIEEMKILEKKLAEREKEATAKKEKEMMERMRRLKEEEETEKEELQRQLINNQMLLREKEEALRMETLRKQLEMEIKMEVEELQRIREAEEEREALAAKRQYQIEMEKAMLEAQHEEEEELRKLEEETDQLRARIEQVRQAEQSNSQTILRTDASAQRILQETAYNKTQISQQQQLPADTRDEEAELKQKSQLQELLRQRLKLKYAEAEATKNNFEEEIGSLVNMYHKDRDPSSSPINNKTFETASVAEGSLSNQHREDIVKEIVKHSQLRETFHRQLAEKGSRYSDLLAPHVNLLDLRLQVEEAEVTQYRNKYEPRLLLSENEEEYAEQLSNFSDPPPPPKTLLEHIKLHQERLAKADGKNSKNFFKINKESIKRQLQEKSKEKEEKKSKGTKLDEAALKRQNESIEKYILRSKSKGQVLPFRKSTDKKNRQDKKQQKSRQASPEQKKDEEKFDISTKKEGSPAPLLDEKSQEQNQQTSNKRLGLKSSNQQRSSQVNDKKQQQLSPKPELRKVSQQSSRGLKSRQQTSPIRDKLDLQEQPRNNQSAKSKRKTQPKDQQQYTNNKKQATPQQSKFEKLELQASSKNLAEEAKEQEQKKIRDTLKQHKFSVSQKLITAEELSQYLADCEKQLNQDMRIISKFSLKHLESSQTAILLLTDSEHKDQGFAFFSYEEGVYQCEHINVFQIPLLPAAVLSFSKYVFEQDPYGHSAAFNFNFSGANFEHAEVYQELEEICIQYGEVYQHKEDILLRRYVVKKQLFLRSRTQKLEDSVFSINSSLFISKSQVYGDDPVVSASPQYSASHHLMLVEQLKNCLTAQEFDSLKTLVKENIRLKQLLLTAVLLDKKGLRIEEYDILQADNIQQLQSLAAGCLDSLNSEVDLPVSVTKFVISYALAAKHCWLQTHPQGPGVPYLCLSTNGFIVKMTSSSYYSQGVFVSLSPRNKMLLIDAEEFLSLTKTNPEIDLFFYIRHFVKNVKEFNKEEVGSVYVPRFHIQEKRSDSGSMDIYKRQVATVDRLHFGNYQVPSSVVSEPRHEDYVVQAPFIFAILSAQLEKNSTGCPIYGRVVTEEHIR